MGRFQHSIPDSQKKYPGVVGRRIPSMPISSHNLKYSADLAARLFQEGDFLQAVSEFSFVRGVMAATNVTIYTAIDEATEAVQ
jgi:hypothetical protein